jgi:acyl-CoA thioesterase-1
MLARRPFVNLAIILVLSVGPGLLWATSLIATEPVRIVCFGDSVTKAVRPGVTVEETFCAVLERTLNASDEQAQVINAGIGGNTTADGLCRLEADVLAQEPDYVVVMFGLNDSWVDEGRTESRLTVRQYRDNLRAMLSTLRQRGIIVVLMTPNPAIAPTYPSERNVTLKAYVEEVRVLAREERVEMIDVYRRFAELAIEGTELNTLFTDAMHPNPAGQGHIAEMLARRFQLLLSARQPQGRKSD